MSHDDKSFTAAAAAAASTSRRDGIFSDGDFEFDPDAGVGVPARSRREQPGRRDVAVPAARARPSRDDNEDGGRNEENERRPEIVDDARGGAATLRKRTGGPDALRKGDAVPDGKSHASLEIGAGSSERGGARPEVASAPGPSERSEGRIAPLSSSRWPLEGMVQGRANGAVRVPGPLMRDTVLTNADGPTQTGDDVENESRSHTIILPGELVEEEDQEENAERRRRRRRGVPFPRSEDERVYDGIAIATQDRKTSYTMGLLRKHRYIVGGVAVLFCIAAAVAASLAARSRRAQAVAVAADPLSSHSPTAEPTTITPSPSTSPRPTMSPTTVRFGSIKSLLLDATKEASISSTAMTLEEVGSAQNSAMKWLVEEDDIMPRPRKNLIQRFALATLYYSTGGDEGWWWQSPNFLNASSHECTWRIKSERWGSGSFCTRGVSNEVRVACGEDNDTLNNVTIGEVCLAGTVPDELGLLTGLQHLKMATNFLHGSIPSSLSNLGELELLDLSENRLTGSVPTSLGRLSKLKYLDLSHNKAGGHMPTELNDMERLEVLNLANMSIRGTLPFALGGNLTNLRKLDLSRNELTGTIPRALFTNRALIQLYLDRNALVGSLPTEIGNLVDMEDIYLGPNKLDGSPPWEGITKLSKLMFLGLGQNKFSGHIPPGIGALTNLELLWLHNNRFSGSLPDSMRKLTNLGYILLSRNKFTGTVPDIFGDMAHLWGLFLDANRFTGRIPFSLSNLAFYGQFSAANTSLTGDLGFLCKSLDPLHGLAIADCLGENAETSCDCCQVCCSDQERSGHLTVSDLGHYFVELFGEGELPGCLQVSPFPWEL